MTIAEALKVEKNGFYIGHRLIFPFRCEILKVIVDGEIITELVGGENLKVNQDSANTSIYLRSTGKLSNYFETYKVIKVIACELGKDLTVMENHVKLVCSIEDNHKVVIEEPNDDMLFIE